MKNFLTALIAGSLLFMPCANAQVMTVTGSDDYIMSEFETIDIAKQRAKQKAMRAAQEQAGVFVQSSTDVVNLVVTNDEIHTLTAGILNVSNVTYSQVVLPNVNGLIIHFIIIALDEHNNICYILHERRIYKWLTH